MNPAMTLFSCILCAIVLPAPITTVNRAFPRQSARSADSWCRDVAAGFLENRGQIVDTDGKVRPDVRYTARTDGARIYFRSTGVSTVFMSTGATAPEAEMSPLGDAAPVARQSQSPAVETYRIDMEFPGCNPGVHVSASGELDGVSNYYLAHCPQGITGVRRFARIVYENLYDHIDLEYEYARGRLKYNFIVHPGGSVEDIRMRYAGAASIRVTDDGTLKVRSPLGSCDEEKPLTYQDGIEVSSAFAIQGDVVSFRVGGYDRTQDLVIDPWATYCGGSSFEYWTGGIATDVGCNVVITGGTSSTNFPVTNGSKNAGPSFYDAFVVKFDSSGSILWATYYGGSVNDWANAVTTYGNGNMVITGDAGSTNFPVTDASTFAGNPMDVFVVAFDATGTRLWATLFGGGSEDLGKAVAADANGNVFVAGSTKSTDLPVTNASTHAGGVYDGFAAAFNSSGVRTWSTYCGGSSDDDALGIAVDATGNAIITGYTKSTNLPVTNASTYAGGLQDGFVVKFSGGGSVLWATYYGGSGAERPNAVATDGNANVLIAGTSNSTDLPGRNGSTNAGTSDAFIATFSSGGVVQWAVYYGGSSGEAASGIAMDGSGNIIIAGSTGSTDLPVSNASVYAGGQADAFAAKFDGSGARLWGTYYGGNNQDNAYGVAADRNGNSAIMGTTLSPNLPVTNASVKAGSTDCFVVHFEPNGTYPVDLASITAERTAAGTVLLRWTTASESGNAGFEVQSRCGPAWQSRAFVPGRGTTILQQSYEWLDADPPCETIFYRLRQVDADGTARYSPVVEAFPVAARRGFAILSLAPQPAVNEAVLRFSLDADDVLSFALHDALGRQIALLAAPARYDRGSHAVTLHLESATPGTYFLNVHGDTASAVQPLVVR